MTIEVPPLPAVAQRLTNDLASSIASLELAKVADGNAAPAGSRDDVSDQVERMALELFETMSRHRVLVMIVDRCATEVPELAGWFGDGRYVVVDLWDAYLERIADHIGRDVDRAVLARTIVELITLWAVKMPWDRAPRSYPVDVGATCARMAADLVMGRRT